MAMCKAMEDALNLERYRAKAEAVISAMKNTGYTFEIVSDILGIPESDRDRIKALVEEGLERGYV